MESFEKTYQEKYLKLNNELKKVKDELKIKNDTIINLKNKNTKYFNTLQEIKVETASLNNRIKEQTQINASKDVIIKNKDTEIQTLFAIKNSYNAIIRNNSKLKNQNMQLVNQNNNFKLIIDNLKSSDLCQLKISGLKRKIQYLEDQIVGCTHKNNALEEKYEEYFQDYDMFYNSKKYQLSIGELIEQLLRSFTVTNSLAYSKIVPFARRVEQAIATRQELRHFNKDEYITNKSEIIFGYLIEESSEITFISLEGKSHKVKNIPIVYRYNSPAKAAVYEDDTVTVLHVYYEEEERFEREINRVKKSKDNKNTSEILDKPSYNLSQFRTLIITGRKEKYYRNDLIKTGLHVTSFNPFDENESELKNKISNQDVIIVIQNAIPHSICNLLDKTDIKIQFVTRDNTKFILARIRFSLIQQGLLILET